MHLIQLFIRIHARAVMSLLTERLIREMDALSPEELLAVQQLIERLKQSSAASPGAASVPPARAAGTGRLSASAGQLVEDDRTRARRADMNLFFDTSALVKYFHEEAGSERVTALIEDPDHVVWLSELAYVEFARAMHRKFREEVLNAKQLKQALDGFAEALRGFQVEPLGSPVPESARTLLQRHGRTRSLRTLDALHLARYVLISEPDWTFVVANDRLHAAALEEGCAVIHPLHEIER